MAEFVQRMRDWKRMCDTIKSCDDCPMQKEDGWTYVLCSEGGISSARPEVAEKVIVKWAAEHPEPVYPTWKEWLEEQRVVVHFDSVSEKGTKVKWELTNKSNCRIPADIAQKLGLQPKEG